MKECPRPIQCIRNTQACYFIISTASLLNAAPAVQQCAGLKCADST